MMTALTPSIDELITMVERQASVIVATGTGHGRIDNFDTEYQRVDRVLVAQFKRLGLDPPFPWRSLWEWYGYYSQELGTYASRRKLVATLKRESLERLDDQASGLTIHDPAGPQTSAAWKEINTRVSGLINEYTGASDKDTWQDVGRRSREILIDLGKLIAALNLVPEGSVHPRLADARAWFELFLDSHSSGRDRAELRTLMRKTWDLAQKVTHGDIDAVDAFAAAQATVLIVRTTELMIKQAEKVKSR